MRIARRFRISGRVQGVGFRCFAREAALREGISGWIRNLPEGDAVEVFVEGEQDAVTRVERVLRRGPRGARVDVVDHASEEASGTFHTFTIT